jgi:hypothetical protein
MPETFSIIGEIHAIETIAEGHSIRELAQLQQRYSNGNWSNNKSRNPLV